LETVNYSSMDEYGVENSEQRTSSNALPILSIVISIGTLLLVGWFAMQMNSTMNALSEAIQRQENPAEQAEAEEEESTIVKTSIYSSPVLNISFSTPDNWGIIEKKDVIEGTAEGPQKAGEQLKFVGNVIFLQATLTQDDYPESLGRGGFWGDDAMNIIGLDAVEQWCVGKSDCNVLTNSHGVRIARHYASVDEYETPREPTTQYYLYNPGSQYPGMVLSPLFLMEGVGSGRALVEQMFADIVDSIQFLD
jgi:hypothetical protein